MRRSDREITDFSQITDIIRECDVCRLGFIDGDVPYILPLNFGEEISADGKITLYFHSATEGKKIDLIKNSGTVAVEMDCNHQLWSDESRGYCTYVYRSIFAKGTIQIITDFDEKIKALDTIVKHYHPEGFAYGKAAAERTLAYKVTLTQLTAKEKKAPQKP